MSAYLEGDWAISGTSSLCPVVSRRRSWKMACARPWSRTRLSCCARGDSTTPARPICEARDVAPRVLVLAPPNIVSQWQFELKSKFNLVFAHYTRSAIDYLRANNPSDNVLDAK